MTAPPAMLTVVEVAEMLGLHPESVRDMARTGRLPAFKAGRSWRFDRDALGEWRRKQRSVPAGKRVLVVDDAPAVRDVIRIALTEAGHHVIVAETAEGAAAALRDPLPDLVLVDLGLANGRAVDLVREIRSLDPELPVVVVTEHPDGDLLRRAMQHSPFTVLGKPVDPDRLLQVARGAGRAASGIGLHPAVPRQSLRTRGAPAASYVRLRQGEPLCSVLVIDDDELVCRALCHALQRMGCRARHATRGDDGLALVAAEAPDLVTLDLMMPDMDGVAFLKELRRTHEALPVVIVTGFPESRLMAEAMRFAPVMLLAKPVETELLERTVRSVVGGATRAVANR